MPNKPSWRHRLLGIGALVALAFLTWGLREHFAPSVPPATALRAELTLRDGALHLRDATTPFTGLLVEDWRPGQRRTEVTVRAGRAHGLSRGWFENGRLEVEETFVHGVSHGTRTRYFPDGAKKSAVSIRDGQLAGTFREWHANGRLARETPLVAGVPHGEVRSWDEQGTLTGTARVERGQRVSRH